MDCCDSKTDVHLGTCLCPIHDMERQGCAHCREKGLYVPPPDSKTESLNLSNTESMAMEMDDAGGVWIGPNEAFLQGRFGKGKHLH